MRPCIAGSERQTSARASPIPWAANLCGHRRSPVWQSTVRGAISPGVPGRAWTDQGRSCGLSHIMADFRQIMWRKFLRNLCQYSTMTQKVLPHNMAWPCLPFLPSCCRPLSTAILCGRKKLMAPKVALMLRQMVLTDNMAPQIFFLQLTRKPVAKKFLGASPYYASEIATACRENPNICACICLETP